MTDKDYQKQKSRITPLLDKWAHAGFNWWRITYVWDRNEKPDFPHTAADCEAWWQYRSAKITFYLPVCEDADDEELERIVVHELVHVLIGSIHNFENDETREMTEYATENVTRALLYTNKFVKKEVSE